tara:strand:+ start:15020 stop:19861 length:4842 start_codon:yes stop_codon:yes gene_type:complete
MKRFYPFLFMLVLSISGFAQLSMTNSGTAAVITFDGTLSGVNEGAFNGTGLEATPLVGQLDSDAWLFDGFSTGTTTFGGSFTTGDHAKGFSTGGETSGGIYAFEVAAGDTALGVHPTGSDFTPGSITLKATNNIGITTDSITISYTLYINNDATRANSFNPSYSTDGTNFTALSTLDETSVELDQGSVNWVAYQKDTTLLVSVANGSDFFIKWDSDDISGGGSRDEFALDNISITAYGSTGAPSNYTLQILHASDLEGGVEAVDRAKYFAAIVDTLEDEYANSITLSAGDNYIPGPFFNAAGDQTTFRDNGVFNNVYNRHFGVTTYNGLRETPGRADITIMNLIGFDASAVGNHEFDAGADAVADIIQNDFRTPNGPGSDRWVGAQFPYLSANLDFSNSGSLGGLYSANVLENTDFVSGPTQSTAGTSNINKIAAATYITRGGEKIGVVGATTPFLSTISSPGDVTVKGPSTNDMMQLAAEIQPWVDSLVNNHGINKIILVTHLQQIALEEMLAGMVNNVDVIIAGGSDAILANSNDRLNPGDVAVKPYPVMTTNGNGDPLAIVSTDGEYSYVGRLVVEFDANGVLVPSAIDSMICGPYAADSAMVAATWGTFSNAFADPNGKAALVDSITSAVRGIVIAKDGNVFGQTSVYLNGERTSVRSEETNFGNLSADANLWTAQQFDPSVAVSIKNGGGIRAAIGEVVETAPGQFQYLPPQANPVSGKATGEVSQLDIENSLRFNNGLTVLDLDANGLKAVIEHGVAAWAPGATPGQFCQVGGVQFSFDPSMAAGNRVRSMILVDASGNTTDTIVKNGTVYGNASRTIKVVTLDFLSGGGDGYPYPTVGSNFVDLDTVTNIPVGAASFAPTGSEQDALADYLVAQYAANPFNEADEEAKFDNRIQNLSIRHDGIFGTTVAFDESRISVEENAGTLSLQVNYNNPSTTDTEIRFRVMGISTADASDYTIASLTDTARANQTGSFNLSVSIVDDNTTEADEIIFIEIDNDSTDYDVEQNDERYMLVFIRDNENVGPTANGNLSLTRLPSYQGLVNSGSTEILDYDPVSQRMFVTNSDNDRFEILDFSNPSAIVKIDSIDVSNFGAINSLAVHGSVVACAIEGANTNSNGVIAFYDTNGVALSNVTVGVLPDMVTFSPNGNTVVVACEGEPDDTYTTDPEGSIAIIDVSGGIANVTASNVTLLNFNAYDSQINTLRTAGIRIFGPSATVSQDMEPEYVTISEDNTTAYVVCQENNALVIVDLTTNTISSIAPLGYKDHSLARNGFDTDRNSDNIHIASGPFRGYYMPDAIATYKVAGTNYVVSANEGDSRDYNGYSEEARFDDLTLDPTMFPNAEELFEAYGDIKVTLAQGDTDNDGDYDAVYTYGARSFSIWNGTTGALVYDSGDDFEQIVSNDPYYVGLFNSNEDDADNKNRSDDKGPEPEAVTLGKFGNTTYAFIGMERTGGVMVYDITNPAAPAFVTFDIPKDTISGAGDQAPEGLVFIDSTDSPTGLPLLVAANEVSKTLSIWEIADNTVSLFENKKAVSKLSVYPNPASEQVFVSAEGELIEQVQIYDMNGRLVREYRSTKAVQIIDVQDLDAQVYLIKIQTENGISTSKLSVK